jgi:iron(III) transport system ATP-binding protein
MLLEIEDVTVAYDARVAAEQVDFALAPGSIGCLLGPSGSGKSTVLRAIAGFEPVRAGRIVVGGHEMSTPRRHVPPERRSVGMVFQDFALFSHLNVAGNIAFGIRAWSATDRRARIAELLQLVGLAHRERSFPHQLSGGEQQRVALARALAPRPRLLLLDEPFSSLDVTLRAGLAREVRRILRHEGMTAVLVTHDQAEAFAMADEIGVMRQGRLLQWAAGYDLYHRPASRFVAQFVGQGTLIAGTVVDANAVATALGVIQSRTTLDCVPGARVEVLMRPDDLLCVDAGRGPTGTIVEQDFRGAEYLYTIRLDNGEKVLSLARSHEGHPVGTRVGLQLDTQHLIVFAPDAAQA